MSFDETHREASSEPTDADIRGMPRVADDLIMQLDKPTDRRSMFGDVRRGRFVAKRRLDIGAKMGERRMLERRGRAG
jgi:hypothetical protein